ncbi:MAG: cytochrome c-type biogenesis protein CcmH [Betaproteobacteria bacterium]|nr:cytochrome c-type biogenesis protein CcmH [Betaproteobacteria bacterium]
MRRLALVLVLALGLPGLAQQAPQEARLRLLEEKLRCLVCQNQSLADSPAGLADDLRRTLREQVKSGRSDQEILDFMVARYGDFVLYKPPFKATTALLWVGPFVLLALALVTLAAMARRRRNATAEPDLGAEERRLVAQALGTQEDRK